MASAPHHRPPTSEQTLANPGGLTQRQHDDPARSPTGSPAPRSAQSCPCPLAPLITMLRDPRRTRRHHPTASRMRRPRPETALTCHGQSRATRSNEPGHPHGKPRPVAPPVQPQTVTRFAPQHFAVHGQAEETQQAPHASPHRPSDFVPVSAIKPFPLDPNTDTGGDVRSVDPLASAGRVPSVVRYASAARPSSDHHLPGRSSRP